MLVIYISWLLFPHEYSGEGLGNETNFQIEQIVLLISLSIVLTLYIILELPLFDCIIR
jgi:hypothetical protein